MPTFQSPLQNTTDFRKRLLGRGTQSVESHSLELQWAYPCISVLLREVCLHKVVIVGAEALARSIKTEIERMKYTRSNTESQQERPGVNESVALEKDAQRE